MKYTVETVFAIDDHPMAAHVDDESEQFILDEKGNYFPADEFFSMVTITDFETKESNYNKVIPVASSNLNSAMYVSEESTLIVEFKGGKKFKYFDVPAEVFDDMLSAPSIGSFFSRVVKPLYKTMPMQTTEK